MAVKNNKVEKDKDKPNRKTNYKNIFSKPAKIILSLILAGLFFIFSAVLTFENSYKKRVYPGVRVDNIQFGKKTKEDIEKYFVQKNAPFDNLTFIFNYQDKQATLSGKSLNINFDAKLSAQQAYLIGRSGYFFSDIYQKWQAKTDGINIESVLTLNTDLLDEFLDSLSISIDIEPEDAQFKFLGGKVTAFKLGRSGRKLNKEKTKDLVLAYISKVSKGQIQGDDYNFTIDLPVETVEPKKSNATNNFGIKELLARGSSKFAGSIASRVHNIALSASRINGNLVAPGEIFSFNEAVGDISQSTGFQPAYIIKNGRTVLGDGGGVCQVSTTLFRAALNAGLPIIERHPHSYRVSYYEQDSPPGFDATIFAPSYDLKFKNDTNNYFLIQAVTDTQAKTLTFEIYGTPDGRKVEISEPIIYSQTPPPPDLYQDDPTLPKGVVKQVDWKAWGSKVSFDYKVTKNEEEIFSKTFFSNFQPWQAVFLRGTKE